MMFFLKCALGILLGLVLIAGGFVGYVIIATDLAERHARAFCAAIPAQASAQGIMSKAASSGAAPELTLNFENAMLSIGWRGAFLDRWYCNIELANGRVVKKGVHFLD